MECSLIFFFASGNGEVYTAEDGLRSRCADIAVDFDSENLEPYRALNQVEKDLINKAKQK